MYYRSEAYDLGNDYVRCKEDGTVYTIEDFIKDSNITDPKDIEKAKMEYAEGRKEFFRLQSISTGG